MTEKRLYMAHVCWARPGWESWNAWRLVRASSEESAKALVGESFHHGVTIVLHPVIEETPVLEEEGDAGSKA